MPAEAVILFDRLRHAARSRSAEERAERTRERWRQALAELDADY
jgi:hypothetical protein